jgi:hypothetical protein
MTGLDCRGTNMSYAGHQTVCDGSVCCVGDFNHAGGVTVEDLFGYLEAWLSGNPQADANADGQTGFEDLTIYIQSFLGGC